MVEYSERIRRLRAVLEKKKLDAFVTAFLPHLRYLTGFAGSNGLCVVSSTKVFFLTDFRYKEAIQSGVSFSRSFITSGSLVEKAAEAKILRGCRRIGFEEEYSTYAQYAEMRKNFRSSRLAPVADFVEPLSAIKDDAEIALIRKAVEITDTVFLDLLSIVKAGVSELDVSAEISYLHKKYGAEKDSFDPIVVSGTRGSLPHGRPSTKKIKRGEMVTLDLGCFYRGYCSDLTRTIAVGKPTAEAKTVYAVVAEAQRSAISAAKDGMSAKELDSVARGFIHAKGYGKYFGHGLGHGIGLQIHEALRLSPRSTQTLRTGNVVTIEPGIYLPKKFGVRIEDDIVIREGRCVVLTRSPKELIVV